MLCYHLQDYLEFIWKVMLRNTYELLSTLDVLAEGALTL